jgi:hypothetical protein
VVSDREDASAFSSLLDVSRDSIHLNSDSQEVVANDEDPNGTPTSSTGGRTSVWYKSFKRYDSRDQVNELVLEGNPISVIELDGGANFLAVFKDPDKLQVVYLRRGGFVGSYCGMAYFQWSVDPAPVSIGTFGNGSLFLEGRISRKALLLPLIQWGLLPYSGNFPEDGSVQKSNFKLAIPPMENHPMQD